MGILYRKSEIHNLSILILLAKYTNLELRYLIAWIVFVLPIFSSPVAFSFEELLLLRIGLKR